MYNKKFSLSLLPGSSNTVGISLEQCYIKATKIGNSTNRQQQQKTVRQSSLGGRYTQITAPTANITSVCPMPETTIPTVISPRYCCSGRLEKRQRWVGRQHHLRCFSFNAQKGGPHTGYTAACIQSTYACTLYIHVRPHIASGLVFLFRPNLVCLKICSVC